VFSGDDHDYCEHRHPQGVREITLKSFSSSTGIRRPGFQLLSLIPPHEASSSTSATHADSPCFLPDQSGVYYRVYLPVAILTFIYLFATNIRAAWKRWNAAGHSIYGDLKSRMSPHVASSEFMPNAPLLSRRVSERPVPLTLPSRKSSQHLNGLGSGNPHNHAYGYGGTPLSARSSAFATRTPSSDYLGANYYGQAQSQSIKSAPVSPTGSPRPSWSWSEANGPPPYRSRNGNGNGQLDEDIEADSTSVYDASPSMSRRSSYIYMNGNGNGHPSESTPTQRSVTAPSGTGIQSEPSSYFLPIPHTPHSHGLGISTPTSAGHGGVPVRRSSSNLSNAYAQGPGAGAGAGGRRVTAPRMLSTADWQSAAKAKDKSVIGLLADSLPLPSALSGGGGGRRGGLDLLKGFMAWLWRSRNGVVGKSWRECLAVAWPAAVVWVLVNALFFWS
jgi:hypothetical protein